MEPDLALVTMEKVKVTIRYGTAADAGLLASIGATMFYDTFAADNTPEDMATYLAASFSPEKQAAELVDPTSLFLIAEIEAEPVGYARLQESQPPAVITGQRPIELVRIYAGKAWLGSGVGASLMQACLDEAERRGCDTIWLGVWERNPRGRAFYRKWGFIEVGTTVFQLGNDLQTDLLMQRAVKLGATRRIVSTGRSDSPILSHFHDQDLHLMNVLIDDLTEAQGSAVWRLQTQDCFANVPGQEIEEDFFTTPVSRILCYKDTELIGCAGTRIREIVYEGNKILLGGISGVCIRTDMRGQGVATRVCRMAMAFLTEAHCDVVFLSTSPMARKLYEKLGFRALTQGFSWENLHGQIKIGENGMVAPICSPAIAAAIWNGQSRLHVGRGYW